MPPLQQAEPVPDRGREMVQLGDAVQAGRSASALGAEVNSAEIRSQASIPNPTPSIMQRGSSELVQVPGRDSADMQSNFSAPSATLRDSSGSTLQGSRSSLTQLDRNTSTLSLNRKSSYIPAILSPLNPASSQSSFGSNEESVDGSPIDSQSSGDTSRKKSTTNIAATGGARRKSSTLTPAQQLLRQKSAAATQRASIPRPETPIHLEDLGKDYSRYPLPSSPRRHSGTKSALLRTTTSNPYSDSEADISKWGYPDDRIGAFDPYFGGEKGFILYSNELEDDDKFHMPADDDDRKLRFRWRELFRWRLILSTIGGIFLLLGLLCVLIVLPVVTYTSRLREPTGKGRGGNGGAYDGPSWAHVNNNTFALLNNVRTGLIDPQTPIGAKTRVSTFDGSTLNLVFSDEFNEDNRTFYPGDDPFWTGADIWYGATQDLEWYDPDAITTGGGTLQLRMDAFANHNLQYRSGMLNSWNQLCFKGGVFEISVSLAGPAGVPGLWPGAWTMGNLGRPGYKATTDGVWPYTYDSCDVGITPNQSSPDGISFLPGQKLSCCTCHGEDHPSPGTGRGAPEIDILEGSVDPNNRLGVVTQSYQVAPFDYFYRPNSDFLQIPNYDTTQMNGYCGGPYQQAVSGTTLLNNDWYNGTAYQKYAFEYVPGTSNGKIAWFVGEDQTFMMDGRAIGPNGNVAARQVSEEPMSMVLNLGISGSWSEILFGDLIFPTIMHIDYVRIYQKPGEKNITCDPPGYPTTEYIQNHADAYNNPNLTHWNETGYSWPKNTLTGC